MIQSIIIILFILFSANTFSTPVDDGVTLFNQKEYKQAQAVFEPLAKQGNARAMFWLGVSQFKTGEQFKAGSTLLQAAEAGNPWAMHLMVPSYNGHCGYLGWPCDEDWMDKAIVEWKKRADQGDGKAMYALLRWGEKPWWAYVPVLKQKKYGELVEKAVKAGGYNAVSYNMYIPIDMKKSIELLKYEVSQGYAPAMIYLYYLNDSKKITINNSFQLAKRALSLGYSTGAFVLYFHFRDKLPSIETESDIQHLSNDMKENYKNAYYYSLIEKNFSGEDRVSLIRKMVINNKGEKF
ncbi:SEL1-like repeat protein [Vibrio spartinae]|uniref:Sel1 repeat protein n=1 Tax=Vibrio spartinae TaxID=1918945 RepID=A0ABX6R701_9VIBR|nr:sel1 repeat family protein [Vibrio spartinae]QMV17027.1 hypothetical protein Vspart_04452 [Vibrio spartinae]